MGAACSRKCCRKKQPIDEEEVCKNVPHHRWPSLNNEKMTTLNPTVMVQNQLKASEKGKHDPPPAMADIISATGVQFTFGVNDHDLETVDSGEVAPVIDKDERNTDEKRRLSRILSGRASTVRNMTSIVAKKGASRVRASLCLCCFPSSIPLLRQINWPIASSRRTGFNQLNQTYVEKHTYLAQFILFFSLMSRVTFILQIYLLVMLVNGRVIIYDGLILAS